MFKGNLAFLSPYVTNFFLAKKCYTKSNYKQEVPH